MPTTDPDVGPASPTGMENIIQSDVELDLTEAHRKIILTEARLKLMETLLEKGLCTKDIYSFACTQADLCEIVGDLDKATINFAMKNKIRDLRQVLKTYHRQRRKCEGELLKTLGGWSWKVIKKVKQIRNSLNKEKTAIRKKHEMKIEHYKSTMKRLNDREGAVRISKQAVVMDEMNKDPLGGEEKRAVVMDEMNKDPSGGGEERAVVMNEMNKAPTEGGRKWGKDQI